jgi:hypothetical protein
VSDIWVAIAVGVIVPVVVLLGPYAWMLLPRYWERRVSPEERARITQQYVDDYQAGLAAGLRDREETRDVGR